MGKEAAVKLKKALSIDSALPWAADARVLLQKLGGR